MEKALRAMGGQSAIVFDGNESNLNIRIKV